MEAARKKTLLFVGTILALSALLFFLFPPDGFYNLSAWKPILRHCMYLAIAVCFALYFWKVRIDLLGALVMAYFGVLLLSTALMGDSLWGCMREHLRYVAVVLLVRALFDEHKKELLWAAFLVTTAYLLANFIGWMAFPSGTKIWHPNWFSGFLGNRNSVPRFVVLAVCSAALLDYFRKGRLGILTVVSFVIGAAQDFASPSSTGIIALIFMAVAFALIQKKTIRKFANIAVYAIAYLAAFFGLVVFRLQGVFEPIIVEVFHKNMNLSGRTEVWDTVLQRWLDPEHFLIGYGGWPPYIAPDSTIYTGHNAILDVLYNGGLVGLLIALTICGVVFVRLYYARATYEGAVVAAAIGGFLILGVMEHITCVPFCLLLAYGYCAGNAVRRKTTGTNLFSIPTHTEH